MLVSPVLMERVTEDETNETKVLVTILNELMLRTLLMFVPFYGPTRFSAVKDFCSGGEDPGSPEGTVEDIVRQQRVSEQDLVYKSFMYYMNVSYVLAVNEDGNINSKEKTLRWRSNCRCETNLYILQIDLTIRNRVAQPKIPSTLSLHMRCMFSLRSMQVVHSYPSF